MADTINPYDNDRLKTRKVRQSLAAAGQLPARRSQQPTFLRSTKTNEHLINTALAGEPIVLLDSPRRDAMTINNAFGALASGDFTNIATNNAADGIYTLNGVPCAIGDILAPADDDPNNFDPVLDIDVGGIKSRFLGGVSYSARIMVIVDPLLTTLLNGYTVLFEIYCGTADDGSTQITPNNSGFSIDTYAQASLDQTKLFAIDATEYLGIHELTPSAINRIAFTMTDARMAVSVNGGTVHAIESGCLTGAELLQIFFGTGANGRLRSFTFYEVVDDAALLTLSAM